MTKEEREEAIYQLNREIHNAKVLGRRFWYYETAIEALKTVPCEDAISRASALSEIALRHSGEPLVNLKGWLHKKWEKKYAQYLECEKIIKELPAVKPTAKDNLAVEQIKWERDVAIEQLKELGYGLGEKIRTDEDCISRQAVLDRINQYIDKAQSSGVIDAFISFETLVVKGLPSIQPTAKKNLVVEDCISRQAVDRLAMRYLREPTDKYVAFYEEFIALPPVTPKPKTGHWIYDKSIENWRCSECKETPKTMGYCGTANLMAEHFKFCNHCGARMVEQQESEVQE